MSKTNQELYQEREKRIIDAIHMKKTDRVPIMVGFGTFASKYAGYTCEEDLYDLDKCLEAQLKTTIDFQADTAGGVMSFGSLLESLDYKQLKWAGHGLGPDLPFQYVEGEYMTAEEYDHFLFDPSDFIMRKYWPRIFGKLSIFGHLPPIRSILSYYMGCMTGFMAFGLPAAQEAFEALKKAGEETMKLMQAQMKAAGKFAEAGFPPFPVGAITQAPFDTLGDFLRGTKGLMIDMYRRPDKVLQACEKLLPMMVECAVTSAKMSGKPLVFIPLHKGPEGFMSLEQFRKFYWPTLKELMLKLIGEGLIPFPFFEGDYTSRLDIIKDMPEGKVVYSFEQINLERVKETLAGRFCIHGGFPVSLLIAAGPDEIKACCRSLIDTLGSDGNYILATSTAVDYAKPENLRTMIEYAKEYGVY